MVGVPNILLYSITPLVGSVWCICTPQLLQCAITFTRWLAIPFTGYQPQNGIGKEGVHSHILHSMKGLTC